MFIKAKRRGGFKQFSDYLQGNAGNDNENEAVHLISDSLGLNSINDFCILTSNIAAPSRLWKKPVEKSIEHISIRTRAGDILTAEAIQKRIPRLLEALGYQDCPWLLVQHQKKQPNGSVEPHYHLGILRIDSNGKLKNPNTVPICKLYADKFAIELGFKPASAQGNGNRFQQQKDHLIRLWSESEKLKPTERLKKFQKGGFTAARGDRGQLIFVDRYGKPHSLHRIPALKAKGLKQADFPAAFGFDSKKMAALPTLKAAQQTIQNNKRRKHNVRRTANKIIRSYGKVGRIYQNALSPMFSRSGMGNRGTTASLAMLACLRGLSRRSERDELRPVRGTGGITSARTARPVAPTLNPRTHRVHATMGWWVVGKAEGVFKAMIAAGATEGEAERAAELVYIEEQQRLEAEQRYLDWLHEWEPKRGEVNTDNQPSLSDGIILG